MLYTPRTIRAALCPNEAAHRILQVAAIGELADRVQADEFQPNLERVLFPDAPKAAARAPRGTPRQRPVTPPSRQGPAKRYEKLWMARSKRSELDMTLSRPKAVKPMILKCK